MGEHTRIQVATEEQKTNLMIWKEKGCPASVEENNRKILSGNLCVSDGFDSIYD
jgi:hypothetical protein